MQLAELPENEQARLHALHSLNILDTPSESQFDAITSLLQCFFEVPVASISLVDSNRVWFKSIQGLNVKETKRATSFCSFAILHDSIFTIPDTLKDSRFIDNPLVTGQPKIRFYAGCAIKTDSGHSIGCLCLVDTKPRDISDAKLAQLSKFAAIIQQEFINKRQSMHYLNEIANIQEMYIANKSANELFEYILHFLLEYTGSKYGFIGSILIDNSTGLPYLKTYAITNIAWNDETQLFYQQNVPHGLEFKNLDTLFGYTIKTGKLVMTNSPNNHANSTGIPKGHPPLNSYLGVPIHGKDGLIAMYGLANRDNGYNSYIAEELSTITKTMASIIEATRGMAIVENMAKKDQLTGAYNRFYLRDYVSKKFTRSLKTEEKHALIMIDLDYFKDVNDYYGHQVGDVLLKLFILRLNKLLRQEDFVARIGGDEFIVFLENIESKAQTEIIAEQIKQLAKDSYLINGTKIKCTVSIGIAIFPESGTTYDDLSRKVDLALYHAKKERNNFAYYSDTLNDRFQYRVSLEGKMQQAIQNDDFYCIYQPQYNITTKQIIGIEALIRCKQNISPYEFVPVIESMGLASQFNKIVVNQVINDIKHYIHPESNLKVAINITLEDIEIQEHMLELAKKIQQSNIIGNQLTIEFEITENNRLFSSSEDSHKLRQLSQKLKKNNFTLAIDDFGIKQSSINRLIESDFSTIKIDKTFIDRLTSNQAREAIAVVKAVMSIANDLAITVVAEGVENKQQVQLLKQLGVHSVQGYYFSKPISIQQFSRLYETSIIELSN